MFLEGKFLVMAMTKVALVPLYLEGKLSEVVLAKVISVMGSCLDFCRLGCELEGRT